MIDLIMHAYVKAWHEFGIPEKDMVDDEGHKYPSIASMMRAAKPALRANDLVLQSGEDVSQSTAEFAVIWARLLHKSGQSLESQVRLPTKKPGMKASGIQLSFGRRICMRALLFLDPVADAEDESEPVEEIEGKPITKAEIANLDQLMLDADANVDGFKKYLGIESFSELDKVGYRFAVRALREKIKRQKPMENE